MEHKKLCLLTKCRNDQFSGWSTRQKHGRQTGVHFLVPYILTTSEIEFQKEKKDPRLKVRCKVKSSPVESGQFSSVSLWYADNEDRGHDINGTEQSIILVLIASDIFARQFFPLLTSDLYLVAYRSHRKSS